MMWEGEAGCWMTSRTSVPLTGHLWVAPGFKAAVVPWPPQPRPPCRHLGGPCPNSRPASHSGGRGQDRQPERDSRFSRTAAPRKASQSGLRARSPGNPVANTPRVQHRWGNVESPQKQLSPWSPSPANPSFQFQHQKLDSALLAELVRIPGTQREVQELSFWPEFPARRKAE
nr:uncharacterized protein LOC111758475 isoform X2 [Cavia porcellus]